MAFKDNFRIEKIYFQRVKDDAQILGSWKNDPRRYSREEIVRVAKDACDSILMLYRLIGEAWNDALNHIEKLSAELDALAQKTDAYHDELNEKIDEVNNYLNAQIKELEVRLDKVEADLESLVRNIILDLAYDETEQTYSLKRDGETVTFEYVSELYNAPSIVFVRGMLDSELTYLVPREYDMTMESGLYEWASMGFVNDTIHEITVTMLPDDSVNVSTDVFSVSAQVIYLVCDYDETNDEYSIKTKAGVSISAEEIYNLYQKNYDVKLIMNTSPLFEYESESDNILQLSSVLNEDNEYFSVNFDNRNMLWDRKTNGIITFSLNSDNEFYCYVSTNVSDDFVFKIQGTYDPTDPTSTYPPAETVYLDTIYGADLKTILKNIGSDSTSEITGEVYPYPIKSDNDLVLALNGVLLVDKRITVTDGPTTNSISTKIKLPVEAVKYDVTSDNQGNITFYDLTLIFLNPYVADTATNRHIVVHWTWNPLNEAQTVFINSSMIS